MTTFKSILDSHVALSQRRARSRSVIAEIKTKAESEGYFKRFPTVVFCAGSLSRLEIGKESSNR